MICDKYDFFSLSQVELESKYYSTENNMMEVEVERDDVLLSKYLEEQDKDSSERGYR